MFICIVEDKHDKLRITLFNEKFTQFKDVLKAGAFIIMTGKTRKDKFTGNFAFMPDKIYNVAQARMRYAKCLMITLDHNTCTTNVIDELANTLQDFTATDGIPVQINYSNKDAKVLLSLDKKWSVIPVDKLLDQLDNKRSILQTIVYS